MLKKSTIYQPQFICIMLGKFIRLEVRVSDSDKHPDYWGESVEGITYSVGLDCRECGWDFPQEVISSRETFNCIVGFREAPFGGWSSEGTQRSLGALVLECPRCFSKFWFHAREYLVNSARRHCSRWSKVDK